jgi:hypothetical protein
MDPKGYDYKELMGGWMVLLISVISLFAKNYVILNLMDDGLCAVGWLMVGLFH